MAGPPPHTGFAFTGFDNLHNDLYPAISPSTTPSLKQPGKVVLVTGASRGIGRSIGLQYAHAGVSTLVLLARSAPDLSTVEAEIKSIDAKIKVLTFALNVTDIAAVKTCAEEVQKSEGKLHVLINNAGVSSPWEPLAEGDPTAWWSAFEINTKGPYLLLQSFLPLLVATAEAEGTTTDVVNVSSIGAHVVMPGASSYQVAKFALLRLTEFVDGEYGGKGINCVVVHPGGVPTDMAKGIDAIKHSEFFSALPTPSPLFLLAPLVIVWFRGSRIVADSMFFFCTALKDNPELCGGWCVWFTNDSKEKTWLRGRYVSVTWDVEKLVSMKGEIVAGDKLKMRMVV